MLDPSKIKEFEHYGKMWIPLVRKFGGIAAYEDYRTKSFGDPECQAAFMYAEETRCFLGYERTFFRPVFE